MVHRYIWESDEYRGLKYTRQIPAMVCTSCGEGLLGGKDIVADENKLDAFKALADSVLGDVDE